MAASSTGDIPIGTLGQAKDVGSEGRESDLRSPNLEAACAAKTTAVDASAPEKIPDVEGDDLVSTCAEGSILHAWFLIWISVKEFVYGSS